MKNAAGGIITCASTVIKAMEKILQSLKSGPYLMGVEFEFIARYNRRMLIRDIAKNFSFEKRMDLTPVKAIKSFSYARLNESWELVHSVPVSFNSAGVENFISFVQELTNQAGIEITRSCGIHVNISRPMPFQRELLKQETGILGNFSVHKLRENFCKERKFTHPLSKYKPICWKNHNLIEYRIFNGTKKPRGLRQIFLTVAKSLARMEMSEEI